MALSSKFLTALTMLSTQLAPYSTKSLKREKHKKKKACVMHRSYCSTTDYLSPAKFTLQASVLVSPILFPLIVYHHA